MTDQELEELKKHLEEKRNEAPRPSKPNDPISPEDKESLIIYLRETICDLQKAMGILFEYLDNYYKKENKVYSELQKTILKIVKAREYVEEKL